MTVSLSNLKALRAEMRFSSDTAGLITDAISSVNAIGIIATQEAADVLLEIAQAVLSLRDSRCDCTTEFHDSTTDSCPMGNAEVRLAALLHKVQP